MSKNEEDWVRTGQGQDESVKGNGLNASNGKNAVSGLRPIACARAAALTENVTW